MRADRRHELRESDLAHWLTAARTYLEENGKTLATAVIGVAVVVVAVSLVVRSRSASLEDAWRRKGQLAFDTLEKGKQSLESLRGLTSDVSDQDFQFVSLVDQGREALRLAREATNPPDLDLNEQARKAFEQLLARFKDRPLAVAIARSNLATVEENAFLLSNGDPACKTRAKEHLTAIIDDPALNGLPFQRLAVDRRGSLDRVFTVVNFAPAPPPPPTAEAPAGESTPPGSGSPVPGPTAGTNDSDPSKKPDGQPAPQTP